jgi:sulfite reductase (NADPH) flavoprotein alpha-component
MPHASNAALTPLAQDRSALLMQLCDGLDAAGLWWISGYAAASAKACAEGVFTTPGKPGPELAAIAAASHPASIVYGSQTGNAKRIATALYSQLQSAGVAARLLRSDVYPLKDLKSECVLYLVISTQGDGDPPEDSRGFVDHILGKRAPNLAHLQFSVLGLGDSSYPKFCSVAKALDARLADLGAQRLHTRADADVEIDLVAAPWLQDAVHAAKLRAPGAAPSTVSFLPQRPSARLQNEPSERFTRALPFPAKILLNQRITTKNSSKDVRHIELSLEGSGLHYQPGDCVGVYPENPAPLVAELLQNLHWSGQDQVNIAGANHSHGHWLSHMRELSSLSGNLLQAHAERAQSAELHKLLKPENSSQLREFLAQTHLLDLLHTYPTKKSRDWQPGELLPLLRPLVPRLYSIASSQKSVPDEVHLTVAHLSYTMHKRLRFGAASHTLARAQDGTTVPMFIEENTRFRLPKDRAADVIMIGPGTGVAPFRAFLQERVEATAAQSGHAKAGRNWLFFGNPNFREDFLYQLEWQQALKAKTLDRLDVAFSRDGASKLYVQHRMLEQAAALYHWLEGGAHLYVCGDASRMAKDVDATLIQIIAQQRHTDLDDAKDYLAELTAQHRYQRDIY